jgi:hypothetical protein
MHRQTTIDQWSSDRPEVLAVSRISPDAKVDENWFSFPRSNYDVLCRIVAASSQCKDHILNIDRIAEICDFDPVVILMNLGFLCNIGVYSYGVHKRLTPDGVRLALSIRDQIDSDILNSWRRLIDKSGVAKPIFAWIRENQGVDKEQFSFGMAALYGKRLNQENSIGIDRMWTILHHLSYLDLRDGRIVLFSDDPIVAEPNGFQSTTPLPPAPSQASPEPLESISLSKGGGPQVHLHLQIDNNCDPERVDLIMRSIAKHFRG